MRQEFNEIRFFQRIDASFIDVEILDFGGLLDAFILKQIPQFFVVIILNPFVLYSSVKNRSLISLLFSSGKPVLSNRKMPRSFRQKNKILARIRTPTTIKQEFFPFYGLISNLFY